MAHWLVVGGNSDIALAIMRQIPPARLSKLTLLGRNEHELQRRSADLAARLNCEVEHRVADLMDADHLSQLSHESEVPDVLLLAAGELMDTADLQAEPERLATTLRINFESQVCVMEALAPRMAENGGGAIVVLNSVAGLRGRPSNYVYGASKAGLTTFLQGFRLRWADKHVKVVNVLTGMVETKMTSGRDLPQGLLAKPEAVAAVAHRALAKERSTVYAPWFWRWIMLVIRFAPGFLVKRL